FEAARQHFSPELWGRIDERQVFMPLRRDEVAQIAHLLLRDSGRRLHAESGIQLSYDDAIVSVLIHAGGWDPKSGARPRRQTIQRLIEGDIARLILSGAIERGDTAHLEVLEGQLHVRPLNRQLD
ncbi:MAG: ATP-dependent Clp protease ATP-binding subunit, partial [Myxococcota bacterium]